MALRCRYRFQEDGRTQVDMARGKYPGRSLHREIPARERHSYVSKIFRRGGLGSEIVVLAHGTRA